MTDNNEKPTTDRPSTDDGGAVAAQSAAVASADRQDERAAGSAERIAASREAREEELEALREPADLGEATNVKMDASGAIMEDGAKKMIDVDHPAVDNAPRANTTQRQNQIDFNDPTATDRQAVQQNLDNQS